MPDPTPAPTPSDAPVSRPDSDPLTRLPRRRPSPHGAYGWVRDLPDHRDHLYAAPLTRFPDGLPSSVDLRPHCPPVYNQGQINSCTGNGIAAAIEFDQRKQRHVQFTPSRLFIYYNERVTEGTVAQDCGGQVRDGIKSVVILGAPPETDWPYDPAQFAVKPPLAAYTTAHCDLVLSYARVAQTLSQMQGCLAEGYPFVLGIAIYESFEDPQLKATGVGVMPASTEAMLGGHCVLAVGYNTAQRTFLLRNSWGPDWGMQGYFTLPFEYLIESQLASDFWTIRSVRG